MVTREDMIEQTVSDLAQAKLTQYSYIPNVVDLREAFPTSEERATEMAKTQVAIGFNFDDGGIPAELGSDLCRYTHTIEFWTFGLESEEGRNVANFLKEVFRSNMVFPLKDVGSAGQPTVGFLEIPDARSIAVARQISANPFPWDRHVFTTTVKVEDLYAPALV